MRTRLELWNQWHMTTMRLLLRHRRCRPSKYNCHDDNRRASDSVGHIWTGDHRPGFVLGRSMVKARVCLGPIDCFGRIEPSGMSSGSRFIPEPLRELYSRQISLIEISRPTTNGRQPQPVLTSTELHPARVCLEPMQWSRPQFVLGRAEVLAQNCLGLSESLNLSLAWVEQPTRLEL